MLPFFVLTANHIEKFIWLIIRIWQDFFVVLRQNTVLNMNTDEPNQHNLPLPSGDRKDYIQKELDQVQGIISRMAANSFQCKGWAIGIVTIVLAIGKDSVLLSGWQSLVLLLPVLMFWYLDGFFLYTEQCYRHLFNDVVRRRFQENNWEYLFNYNHTRFEHTSVRNRSFWLCHLPVFLINRFTRFVYWLTRRSGKAPQKITTIASVMWSKTLLPFYLLPTFFIFFVAFKGMGKLGWLIPEKAEKKEPITVSLDSLTLQRMMRIAQPDSLTIEVQKKMEVKATKSNQ